MSLCICVCANDGRVNSIAIPLPFRFPLYFPTIRTKFEEIRKRIALRRRSIPENEREDKIRFFTRARISKCAQFSRFVSHSLLGTSFAVPFHPRIQRRIRDAISISIVPLLRNEKKKTVHEEREGERRVQRDEHNLGRAVVTMIFPVYFNRVIHFSRGFEREKNISVSLSIHLALFREREREKNTRCVLRLTKIRNADFEEELSFV